MHLPIPAFRASSAEWSSCGKKILLGDQDRFVVAFFSAELEE